MSLWKGDDLRIVIAKLAIKSDNRKQNLLLPPSLEELVPENHMVRVVDVVILKGTMPQIKTQQGDRGEPYT